MTDQHIEHLIPREIVVDEETFAKLLALVEDPRPPTPAMRALFEEGST